MIPFLPYAQLRIRLKAGAWLLLVYLGSITARLPADEPTGLPRSAAQALRPASDELVLSFRREPTCQSQVVRLGDLVQLVSAPERAYDDLLEIPLAPAPPIGATQQWSARDVMRHLQLRGLTQKQLRWSGPDSVTLNRIAEPNPKTEPTSMTPAFVQDRVLSQAAANVAQATREYLWLQTGDRTEWRISVQVPLEHANALSQRRNIQTVSGGTPPWVGEQEMLLGYKYQGKKFEVSLLVQIELPITVVVAARPLRRDEVIEESALEYAALPERMADQANQYFTDFSELVGKQLRRSISSGLPIAESAIGEPIVVSSGELVEIESVAGTISVKTGARALSGGAVGDLVNVELLSTRQRITAMVVGPLQVRVASGSPISRGSDSQKVRPVGAETNRTATRFSQGQVLR